MPLPRIDIGRIRREQIVEAAVEVITEKGLQHLSLSAIEAKLGMSRGQLTYYFKTKEDILLAVFERMLELMCKQCGQHAEAPTPSAENWEEMIRWVLDRILQQPPLHPEFHCLQYTFLAQIGHRPDFRKVLGDLYEDWRTQASRHLAENLARRSAVRKVSARALASFIQAIFHGLVMQLAADPTAFDRQEMIELTLDVLSSYLWGSGEPRRNGRAANPRRNTRPGSGKKPARATVNGVKRHD